MLIPVRPDKTCLEPSILIFQAQIQLAVQSEHKILRLVLELIDFTYFKYYRFFKIWSKVLNYSTPTESLARSNPAAEGNKINPIVQTKMQTEEQIT